jgi:hypothetical protein
VVTIGLVALAGAVAVAGCSGGADTPAAQPSISATSEADSVTEPVTSPETSPDPPETALAGTPAPPAVVPDSGVPGLDSTDRFCRAWSEFAGSFQALALASSQATDAHTAARAEVAASVVIIDAVDALGEELPAELESERNALTVGLVGPMARRARTAFEELQSTGADSDQVRTLGAAWLTALTTTGLDEPNISVTVDADLDDLLDLAAATFAETVPPIANDPSLITDAATPSTFEYLSANCPDQGVLAGNDVVAQP